MVLKEKPHSERVRRRAPSEDELEEAGSSESEEDLEHDPSDSDHPDDKDHTDEMIASTPFGELERMRSDGQGLTKSIFLKDQLNKRKRKDEPGVPHRENKNRPQELSSKIRPPKLQKVIEAPKKILRDPRFETLCGKYEESRFKSQYKFLFEENMPQEKEDLKKAMKKAKKEDQRKELQQQLSRIDEHLRRERERQSKQKLKKEWQQQQVERVKAGGEAFYLKKSDMRKQELVQKYTDLKSSGKLDKFLEKKRKRNSAKDHRYINN